MQEAYQEYHTKSSQTQTLLVTSKGHKSEQSDLIVSI
jgi:hypothetical protein